MKRILIIPALLLALALPACSSDDIGRFLKATTTTVTNPVDTVDIYRAKLTYDSALKIANKYRATCYPAGVTYAQLMADQVYKGLCQSRRSVVRKMQTADDKAFAAIGTAENFVRNNPTLNATAAIGAAWKAVTDFQTLAAPYSGL